MSPKVTTGLKRGASAGASRPGQWVYGLLIGGVTIALRGFSNFSEGIMFSVLIMNAFVPLINSYFKPRRFGSRIKAKIM